MKHLHLIHHVVLGTALLLANPAPAQQTPAPAPAPPLADIHDLTPRSLRTAYFALDSAQLVEIAAVGGEPRGRSGFRRFLEHGLFQSKEDELWDSTVWPGNAWILDLETRQVVWELRDAASTDQRDGVHRVAGTVPLPAGTYAVSYAALFPVSRDWTDPTDWRVRDEPARRVEDLHGPYLDDGRYREFGMLVRGRGRSLSAAEAETARAQLTVLTVRAGATTRQRAGFELTRETELDFYGVGERDGSWNDYGWITELGSRRMVWSFRGAQTRGGGGAARNRVARGKVTLPSGKYLAYFTADDSHHPGAWTETPPYDPAAWGLSVRVTQATDRAAVQPFEYQPVRGRPIVALTGVNDHAFRYQRFTVTRPVDVQIFALGEASGEMVDYGWLVDARGKPVWRMRTEETGHAGGASKNRVYDGTRRLEPGRYTAYYISDGSHSAGGGWNSEPPFDAEYWGLTIAPTDPRIDPAGVTRPNSGNDPGLLARIDQVGDNHQARQPFRLAANEPIRVYAVGEGNGEMFDYGWIEDATGRIVWQMRYADTEPAGGGAKNRRIEATVRLPAGEYSLRYRSDGSHAFAEWNTDPPDDPLAWGIAVYRAR